MRFIWIRNLVSLSRQAYLAGLLHGIARRYSTEEVAKALADLRGVVPERTRLPNRRRSIRETVRHQFSSGNEHEFEVTFGFDSAGAVREVFCAGAHTQSDMQGIIHDACIATSIALQFGASIRDLAKSFGELRDEGAPDGPPASPIGAIARAGAAIEAAFGREGQP